MADKGRIRFDFIEEMASRGCISPASGRGPRVGIMLTFVHMATVTHIPIQEYFGSTYRPDCEYVDGEVRERNVGKWEHARVQWLLACWFGSHEKQWGITGCTEQRVRVAANRVRVPDLVVLTAGPQPDVLTDPPLLVIEILSPGGFIFRHAGAGAGLSRDGSGNGLDC